MRHTMTNNPTPPTNKVTPKGKRTPITPQAAKALAVVDTNTITETLKLLRQRNPALYSLLIATQEEADIDGD